MKTFSTILLLCMFALIGCVPSQPIKMTTNNVAPKMQPDNQNATLVLVGENIAIDETGYKAYLGQKCIGAIQRNNSKHSFFITAVTPGQHYLITEGNGHYCVGLFNFKAGKTYFIGQRTAPTYGIMGLNFRPSGFYPMTKNIQQILQTYSHNKYISSVKQPLEKQVYDDAIAIYHKDAKEKPEYFKEILSYNGIIVGK